MTAKRHHADDLRGASRLVVDATRGVTGVVEDMHRPIFGRFVYKSVRGIATLVGAGLDQALALLGPRLGASQPGPEREALIAAVNGVLGDWLETTKNPLAIPTRLRLGGVPLTLERDALAAAYPRANARIIVFLHGSSTCDLQWRRNGHDYGGALADALDASAVYAHYNSGRHISTNGADMAALLESLVAAWPVPVERLVLVCHSMGGLVARSACVAAEQAESRWRASLRALVTIGTPHHGAPLERVGNLVDRALGSISYSAPLARLGKIRSAGVTDLRHGNVLDEHWAGVDRFASGADRRSPTPLPAGVACLAIAGTTSRTTTGRLPGDGLVPVDSALGRHPRADLCLGFAPEDQRIISATNHVQLLENAHVWEQLRDWLAARALQ
jgi:pimeloyl-ACP methyl ester carboxylesterase